MSAGDRGPLTEQLSPSQFARLKDLFALASERPRRELEELLTSLDQEDPAVSRALARMLADDCPKTVLGEIEEAMHSAAQALAEGGRSGRPSSTPLRAMTEKIADRRRGEISPRKSVATPPTFEVGQCVADRYRIVRFISQGGMGAVYEVEDTALEERVALKTVLPEIAADERTVERFKREIQLARKITHPNISRIYEFGAHNLTPGHGGRPSQEVLFLTMELLEGETLFERIRRLGPPTNRDALPIIEQMVAGLAAAHRLGVIHRDFKPGNVILASSPEVEGGTRAVITDFGLARSFAADSELMSLSHVGEVVGTPAYMAPEQLEGKKLTPAADIYALGIVLYEMMTGRRPFEDDGASPFSLAVRRLTSPPRPPREVREDLDPRWEAVILRCLEVDPKRRFETVEEVVEALQGSANLATETRDAGSSIEAAEVAPARSRLAPWLVAAAFIFGGGIAAISYLGRERSAETIPETASIAAPFEVLVVYDDAAQNGFENYSWAAHDLANGEPVAEGSRSISLEPDEWEGLYFYTTTPFELGDFSGLRFWIHGGTDGGQRLRVILQSQKAVLSDWALAPAPARAWERWTFTFADWDLTAGSFDGLTFQDGTGGDQATVYFDQIELLRSAAWEEPTEPR